jgi:Fe2+ transport system protein FeoA
MVLGFGGSGEKAERRIFGAASSSEHAGEPPFALTSLADGETARVVGFSGGGSAAGKLESMGILPGTILEKKSAAFRQGPIVVARGGTQLALAYAIARGILVEPVL